VAIDPQGGTNFDVVGTKQLLSVPYALYSDKAGMARKVSNTLRGGQANYLSKFDSTGSSSSEIQSVLYDNGNNVGIGTTTPLAKIHIQASANSLPGVRIQNINSTGVGRFLFYNDSTNSYGTMTKYGTAFVGQPAGLSGLYPYANLWTFGNNAVIPNDGSGRTLISSAGNVGIAYVKNGAFKLKFHADYNSGNVGIGGNFSPRAKIHMNNTDSTYINLMLSNTNTGHNITDGLNIALDNKEVSITNREIGSLSFGTLNTERMRVTSNGNVGIGTTNPTTKLDVNGQIRIQGGNPGMGKVLVSDANGLASWQMQIQPVYQQHYIGEHYGGGVVFYLWLDSNGTEHGLIVDMNDLGTNIWSNVDTGTNGNFITNIWDGQSNTNAIINQIGHTISAAQICLNSTNAGYNDWFLPSSSEFILLHTNFYIVRRTLMQLNNSTVLNGYYWTSSEYTESSLNPIQGATYNPERAAYNCISVTPKNQSANIRAIRMF
jgi:hypothetical protein